MIYDEVNRKNLSKLAYHTKQKALEWYEYCKNNHIEILIYETLRTKEQQRENVKKGVSKTMKSYHLVGQALDFVPVDKKGKALWNGYDLPNIKKAINYAKKLGFQWGGDWKGFVDKPHLQFEYEGYGTDTFNKTSKPMTSNTTNKPMTPNIDELVQKTLKGEFGNGEERKKRLGKYYNQVQSIINKMHK